MDDLIRLYGKDTSCLDPARGDVENFDTSSRIWDPNSAESADFHGDITGSRSDESADSGRGAVDSNNSVLLFVDFRRDDPDISGFASGDIRSEAIDSDVSCFARSIELPSLSSGVISSKVSYER